MSHLPPAMVAMGDQVMAEADAHLQEFVIRFREHTKEHNGETLCPFSETAIRAVIDPRHHRRLPQMFAAAVARLAKEDRHA